MPSRTSAAASVALGILLAGCGGSSWGRAGDNPTPDSGETLTQVLDLASVYRHIGRLTAGAPVPFVADVVFLAGAGDSTLAVVGISLENRYLGFQREGNQFVARYQIEISATPATGGPPVRNLKEETVRVGTFAETQRSEESILYQQALTLVPGEWKIGVRLTDRGGVEKTSRAELAYAVPAYGAGSVSGASLVYQAKGRGNRTDQVGLIINPRGSVAYGGDSATAYVEGYRLPGPTVVPVRILGAGDSLVLDDTIHFAGGREVESALVRFAPSTLPLGEVQIVVGDGPTTDTTRAVVAFSSGWVVTNFEEMIGLLRWFPGSADLDSLRKSTPATRDRYWRKFWRESDPNTATPNNEALDLYFGRLALANQRFRDEGVAGWRTDRGEVLIRLGEPDETFETTPSNVQRVIRWTFTRYQLVIYFLDETGFGRYRLAPVSRSEFEQVVSRAGGLTP